MDKYELYENSVQDAPTDARDFYRMIKKIIGREPLKLREDFCGTFWLGHEWAKLSPRHCALGIDLDPKPIAWGRKRRGDGGVGKRLVTRVQDVRKPVPDKFDLAVALNFSYFVFKERAEMLTYFKAVARSLERDGAFLLSHVGGPAIYRPTIDRRACKTPEGFRFRYIWEEKSFNSINNHAYYEIHFETKDGKALRSAFHYDWRMWTLPELSDLLHEAGLPKVRMFFEDDNGYYRERKRAYNDDDQWIAYIVATR